VTNTTGGSGSESLITLLKRQLSKIADSRFSGAAGRTIEESEKFLEDVYSKYYINPFIQIKITNRHAYVFFADGGRGTTVNIINDNTSIIEVIALAGGFDEQTARPGA